MQRMTVVKRIAEVLVTKSSQDEACIQNTSFKRKKGEKKAAEEKPRR